MARKNKQPWQKPRALHVGYGDHKRFVGTLDANKKVYTKYVRESSHLFRKLDAWGIDAEIFTNQLLARNVTIRVNDQETGRMYQVSAKAFAHYGRFFHFKQGDTSHKAQIFLPRAYWTRTPDMDGKSSPIVDPKLLLLEGSEPANVEVPVELEPARVAEHEGEMEALFKSL